MEVSVLVNGFRLALVLWTHTCVSAAITWWCMVGCSCRMCKCDLHPIYGIYRYAIVCLPATGCCLPAAPRQHNVHISTHASHAHPVFLSVLCVSACGAQRMNVCWLTPMLVYPLVFIDRVCCMQLPVCIHALAFGHVGLSVVRSPRRCIHASIPTPRFP